MFPSLHISSLLLLVISAVTANTSSSGSHKQRPIFGELGAAVKLRCTLPSAGTTFSYIEWRFGKTNLLVYFDSTISSINTGPKGKFERRQITGSFSKDKKEHYLMINRTVSTDEGWYTCRMRDSQKNVNSVLMELSLVSLPSHPPAIVYQNGTIASTSDCHNITAIPSVVVSQKTLFLCQVGKSKPASNVFWKWTLAIKEVNSLIHNSTQRGLEVAPLLTFFINCTVETPSAHKANFTVRDICLRVRSKQDTGSSKAVLGDTNNLHMVYVPVIVVLIFVIVAILVVLICCRTEIGGRCLGNAESWSISRSDSGRSRQGPYQSELNSCARYQVREQEVGLLSWNANSTDLPVASTSDPQSERQQMTLGDPIDGYRETNESDPESERRQLSPVDQMDPAEDTTKKNVQSERPHTSQNNKHGGLKLKPQVAPRKPKEELKSVPNIDPSKDGVGSNDPTELLLSTVDKDENDLQHEKGRLSKDDQTYNSTDPSEVDSTTPKQRLPSTSHLFGVEAKTFNEQAKSCLEWIKNTINSSSDDKVEFSTEGDEENFHDVLTNGGLLVRLINVLRPEPPHSSASTEEAGRFTSPMGMKTIKQFLREIDNFGIRDDEKFKEEDLLFKANLPQVVTCLQALSRMAQSGIIDP